MLTSIILLVYQALTFVILTTGYVFVQRYIQFTIMAWVTPLSFEAGVSEVARVPLYQGLNSLILGARPLWP